MKRTFLLLAAALSLGADAWPATRPHFGGTLRVEMREQTAMSCSFNRTRRFPAYSINWPNLTIPFVLPATTESGLGAGHSRSATFSLDSRLNYALSTMPGKGGPFSIASAFKWADRL